MKEITSDSVEPSKSTVFMLVLPLLESRLTSTQLAALLQAEVGAARLHPELCQSELKQGSSSADGAQPIKFYQLLEGNVSFDITQTFLWQEENVMRTSEGPMPTFETAALSLFDLVGF